MLEKITPSSYVFIWGYLLVVYTPLLSKSSTSLVPTYSQFSCDSLQQVLDNIFEEDLAETKETRAIAQDLLQVTTDKNCPALTDALNLSGLIQYNNNDPVTAKNLLNKNDFIIYLCLLESTRLTNTILI